MKSIVTLFFLLPAVLFAQDGYEIKVTFKPFANQYIYLGHYSGKQFPIIDSVKLDANSEGVFRGNKPLGGGIYVVAYPTRDRFFEMLVDKDQHFSVSADTASLSNRVFVGSDDNSDFMLYQQKMDSIGMAIHQLNQTLVAAGTAADSATINEKINTLRGRTSEYRRQIIQTKPNTYLATLMRLMEEPVVPPAAEHPGGVYDSAYAYQYFKSHYWDGLYFFDDRLVRTPASLFDERLDKYLNTIVYPDADSLIHELDYMLGFASVSKEMSRFLLVKFITRYLNQQYMWEDKVFVHLYQKYFAPKDPEWLTPQGKKMITERAYSLMSNITGNPAEDIALPDSTGKIRQLYAETAPYTLVIFWDPTCGHCKEVLPQIDSIYRAKWKAQQLAVYAVAKETEGKPEDWLKFIRKNQLEGWTHVYNSKAEEAKRVSNNIPGYTQLYDAQTVPAIYLLDRDKRIVAKKLTWEQTDEILQLKLKNP
ncbi:MAG: DUF5106 domain-containing protein [Chitinophagaceae bacterium]|nr:DUF5106 domain-containing protein [Chitinophagaceae bacterium]